MFEPLSTTRPPRETETAVLLEWKARKIFEKTLERTRDGKPFVFYEGPPTANGTPHHGHVLTRVVKDLFPRYKTMDGFSVARKAGWDTHGLPVENGVEEQIGSKKKSDIEAYGVAEFIKRCKESVWKYKTQWEQMTDRIGFWLDLEHPYITYSTDYVESVWWALQQIHKKGLLARGYRICPWCPRCGTGLSSHEVGQGQDEVQDPALTVAFKLRDADEHVLAWTTTPWTLLSNVALVVGPEIVYGLFESKDGKKVWLATDRASAFAKELVDPAAPLAKKSGRELAGRAYEPLFDFGIKLEKRAHVVITGDFVTLEDGTGVVHAAPAFGEDDYRVGKANDLAFLQLVRPDGTVVPEAGRFAGLWFKDADKEVMRELRERGLLFRQDSYVHNYPHCWRCDTPLIYYAREGWYVTTTRLKDRLVASNQTIVWAPEHIRDGRFGQFLEDNKDWALSRERYWATPLPIWVCENDACRAEVAIGSRVEWLDHGGAVGGKKLTRDDALALDPHKPAVDDVTLTCRKCKSAMRRVSEVIDCWFDSGAMPFAQWGYPHVEGSREKLARNYPADFICEAIDQTRGWFYTLHAIATLLQGVTPEFSSPVSYRRCLVLGHVLAADGTKMSKSKKNYTPPDKILEDHGADAMRWFFYSKMTPGQGVRFVDESVRDARRTFLLKIQNVYAFFQLACDDRHGSFDPKTTPPVPVAKRALLDRWILSDLQRAIASVRRALDAFDFHAAAETLEDFVEGLSNWYVRRSRDRGWGAGTRENTDKWAFLFTLHEVLVTLAKLVAPFTPFFAEDLYRVLVRGPGLEDAEESVHLERYPVADEALVDPDLAARMALARRLAALGQRARTEAKIKVRQPLGKAFVLLATPEDEKRARDLIAIVADELNVKDVEISREHDRYVSFEAWLDFKVFVKRVGGKKLDGAKKALEKLDPREVATRVREKKPLTVMVDGAPMELLAGEFGVRLRAQKGFAAAEEGGAVVVLDTTITDALKRECLARELVSRVQALRKDLGLAYTARIAVWVSGDAEVESAVREHEATIRAETQADALQFAAPPSDATSSKEKVEGHALSLGVKEIRGT